jgi:hypothetical protein
VDREPKVACVEIDCFWKDGPKGNEMCGDCKPRVKYLKAIENGWTILCYPTDTTIYVRGLFDFMDEYSVDSQGEELR